MNIFVLFEPGHGYSGYRWLIKIPIAGDVLELRGLIRHNTPQDALEQLTPHLNRWFTLINN